MLRRVSLLFIQWLCNGTAVNYTPMTSMYITRTLALERRYHDHAASSSSLAHIEGRKLMRVIPLLLLCVLIEIDAFAQPADAPDLDYAAVSESFNLPAGYNFGAVSGVAINSKGNVFVLNRGPHPVMEFEPGGRFVR